MFQSIQCPCCAHNFLRYASHCPECGKPSPLRRRSKFERRLPAVISVVALMAALLLAQVAHQREKLAARVQFAPATK